MAKKILDSVQVDGTLEASSFKGSGAELTDVAQNATLAGLNTSVGGAISPTDTIVQAIGKLENKVANGTGGTGGADVNYVHTQIIASASWSITHNLNKYPSVTVVDSANSVVLGDISYDSPNAITLTFSGIFSGKAYLN